MNYWNQIENIVGKCLRGISSVFLGIVFALFILNVATRLSFFSYNPTWIDETIQFFLTWMIFLAAAELVRTRSHFVVDFLTDRLHGTFPGRVFALISSVLECITFSIIFFFGVRLCMSSNAMMYTVPVRRYVFYACVPAGAFFMTVFSVRDIILNIQDIVSDGKITELRDAEKARLMAEDDDAKRIAEAAAEFRKDE